MALGAAPADIAKLVLGSGARTVVAGLVAGVARAILFTQFLQGHAPVRRPTRWIPQPCGCGS